MLLLMVTNPQFYERQQIVMRSSFISAEGEDLYQKRMLHKTAQTATNFSRIFHTAT